MDIIIARLATINAKSTDINNRKVLHSSPSLEQVLSNSMDHQNVAPPRKNAGHEKAMLIVFLANLGEHRDGDIAQHFPAAALW